MGKYTLCSEITQSETEEKNVKISGSFKKYRSIEEYLIFHQENEDLITFLHFQFQYSVKICKSEFFPHKTTVCMQRSKDIHSFKSHFTEMEPYTCGGKAYSLKPFERVILQKIQMAFATVDTLVLHAIFVFLFFHSLICTAYAVHACPHVMTLEY